MTDACEIPKYHTPDPIIKEILTQSKTIAVVGLSNKQDRPSYQVADYLRNHGYRIIPVNPAYQELWDEKAYSDLKSIPDQVDIVDIFRKPDAVPEIVEQAITIGAKVIWMQENIIHNDAAKNALDHGLKVVMNKCILKLHRVLL